MEGIVLASATGPCVDNALCEGWIGVHTTVPPPTMQSGLQCLTPQCYNTAMRSLWLLSCCPRTCRMHLTTLISIAGQHVLAYLSGMDIILAPFGGSGSVGGGGGVTFCDWSQ